MSEEFKIFLAQQEFPLYLRVKIRPQAPQSKIIECMADDTWKIALRAVPEKGKANKELLRFFKKEFSLSVDILAGKTETTKLLKINAPHS